MTRPFAMRPDAHPPSARVILALALLDACSGAPTDDTGRDASADVGVDARPRDAGHDSGRDTGADANDGAASSDADSGLCDPGWTRFPDMPDACYVEYAAHPNCTMQVSWLDCAPSLPRPCVRSWIDSSFGLFFYVQAGNAFWDATRSRGVFQVAAQTEPGVRPLVDIRALIATDGEILSVLRTTTADAGSPTDFLCFAGNTASPDALVAYNDFDDFRPRPAPPPHPVHMYRGGYPDWWLHPLSVETYDSMPAGSPSGIVMSSSTVTVAEIDIADYLLIWRAGPPRRLQLAGALTPYAIIGDDLFYGNFCDTADCNTRIYRSGADDTDELLIDATPGTDIRNFTTDGVNMAWHFVTSRDPSGVAILGDVVVAPYAFHAADVHPRTLRAGLIDPEGTGPRLGPDALAYAYLRPVGSLYQSTIDLLLLSDGSRSRVEIPVGTTPPLHIDSYPLWVTADEVAIIGGSSAPQATVWRFGRSAFVPAP